MNRLVTHSRELPPNQALQPTNPTPGCRSFGRFGPLIESSAAEMMRDARANAPQDGELS